MKSKHAKISENFYILPEFEEQYSNQIRMGLGLLSESKIGVLGLCRNIETKIQGVFDFIDDLRDISKSVKCFFYENDSSDRTKQILSNKKESDHNFDYVSEDLHRKLYGQTKEKERTIRLAEYRNKCLDHARKNYEDIDYIMVLDTDFQEISLHGIINSFGWMNGFNEIDALCGFSYEIKNIYQNTNHKFLWNYDSWAFRWTWWEDTTKYAKESMNWFGFWNPPIGSNPFTVNSGFGGCCIYKKDCLLSASYGGEDCEHVELHKNLYFNNESKFNLLANPSQIILF